MVTTEQIQWTAGFLEGEGSFFNVGSGRVPVVTASQVQREPLERLETLFGGSIYFIKSKQPRASDSWRWQLAGQHAVGLIFTLYALMSPKRKEQMRKTIAIWKERPARPHRTGKCKHGHELTPENTYTYPKTGSRSCRVCARRAQKELRENNPSYRERRRLYSEAWNLKKRAQGP